MQSEKSGVYNLIISEMVHYWVIKVWWTKNKKEWKSVRIRAMDKMLTVDEANIMAIPLQDLAKPTVSEFLIPALV